MGHVTTGNGYGEAHTTETRELLIMLTPDELLVRGDEMASAELEAERLRAERTVLNRALKVQVELRAKLAHVIETEQELREVLCEWRDDFNKNVSRLIRTDTAEEVDTRVLTAADRQTALDLVPSDDDRAALGSTLSDAPAKLPAPKRAARKSPPARKQAAKGKQRGNSRHAHP